MATFPPVIDAPSSTGTPSLSGFYPRFWKTLGHPQAAKLVLVLALLGPLPALWTGWECDDVIHKLVMQYPDRARALGLPNTPTPGGLFTFLDGKVNSDGVDRGLFPWWIHPDAKSNFFRPLTFATHWLDYQLWPESPVWMHIHSLAWYALLVAAVLTYFRTLAQGAAWGTLAALLYAIDDAHATPVAWIANRSAILTALFGVLALQAYQRKTRKLEKSKSRKVEKGAWITAFWLAGALLSGEGGAATGAYLLAFALILDQRPLRVRALALVPSFMVVGLWLVVWNTQGYGTYAVGMYTNPFAQPAQYLMDVVIRMPVILLGTLALPPPDAFLLMPKAASVLYVGAAYAMVILIGFWTRGLWVRDPAARFAAVGMVLSALAPCTAFPSDRNLMFVGLGAMCMVARIVAVQTQGDHRVPGNTQHRRLAGVLLVIHIALAGVALPIRASMPVGPVGIIRQLEIPVDLVPADPAQTVVVLNHPSVIYVPYVAFRLALAGKSAPRIRTLSPSLAGVDLQCLDEQTIRLNYFGPFVWHPVDQVFRSNDWPLVQGQEVALSGLTVTVEKVVSHAPVQLRIRFDQPLDDPSFVWIKWVDGAFERTPPPKPGQRISLRPCIPK